MKEFFAFVRHPSRLMLNTPQGKAPAVRLLLWMLLLHFAAVALYIGIDRLLIELGCDSPSSSASFLKAPFLMLIYHTVLLTPLLEESCFRLGLNFKRWQVALMLAACVALCFDYFVHISSLRIIRLSAGLAVGLPVGLLFYLRVNQLQLNRLKQRYAGRTVYLFSMVFALGHLVNYTSFSWAFLPFFLITILQHLFSGLQFSYVRIRLGFWYGCLLHAVFNLIPLAVMYAITLHII